MNPDDSAEADEALGRIRDLCQQLEARDKDDLDEVIVARNLFDLVKAVWKSTSENSAHPADGGT